jgi:hypothetical protein
MQYFISCASFRRIRVNTAIVLLCSNTSIKSGLQALLGGARGGVLQSMRPCCVSMMGGNDLRSPAAST